LACFAVKEIKPTYREIEPRNRKERQDRAKFAKKSSNCELKRRTLAMCQVLIAECSFILASFLTKESSIENFGLYEAGAAEGCAAQA
jgi:hypothetical protein